MVLSVLDLPRQLLFELLKVAALQRGLECEPKVPPEPLLSDHVATDGVLSHQQAPLVVPQPLVDPPGIVGTDDTLSRKDCWSQVINSGGITCNMDTKSLMRSSRISSIRPRIPARKKILVCPYWKSADLNAFPFDLDIIFKQRESYLELVSNQVDLVHHSVRCRNVLLLLSDRPFHLFHRSHRFLGTKNHIASPEVSVENPEKKLLLLNRLLRICPMLR